MNGPLLDELPSGAYSMPTAAGSATLQVWDQILATIVFLLALLQQQELDRSIYYVPLIAGMLLGIITLQAAQDWLRAASARETYHRHQLTTVLSKLAMLVVAYLMGLLTRSVAENITGGPSLGHYNAESIVPALVVVVLLIGVIYQMHGIMNHRIDIVRHLPAIEY